MGLPHRSKIFADHLRRYLGPDEDILALQPATYIAGVEEQGQDWPGFDADTLLDMALGLPTEFFERPTQQIVVGTTLWGPTGCAAERLVRAVERSGSPDLLLTERQLVLIEGLAFDHEREVLRLDRSWVREVTRLGWRFGQAGRLRFTMADASVGVLVLGVFTAGGARRFLRAWERGAPA